MDKLQALEKVKAKLTELIKQHSSTLEEGSTEQPSWLQIIE
jgi:hypothetical protein